MNKVILIGRIANDLELKYTTTGKAVVKFSLAINRLGQEVTDFIPVEVWGASAENLVKYQSKGSQIAVEGSIRVDKYQDQQGQNKTFTKVVSNSVEFLGSKQTQSNNDPIEGTFLASPDFSTTINITDEDLPF